MDVIQAAGAVLWRRLSDDLIQVALIHRPRYDDWSFQKVKLKWENLKLPALSEKFWKKQGFKHSSALSFARLNIRLVNLQRPFVIGLLKQLVILPALMTQLKLIR